MNLLAALSPERLVLRDTQVGVSGAGLSDRVEHVAGHLIALQQPRIALLADNSIDWICVDLACQQAGICLLPLPTFFSKQQILHALELCAIGAVITDRPGLIAGISTQKMAFSECPAAASLQWALWSPVSNNAVLPAGTDKITFTSGSTGQPRGVCLSTSHLLMQARRLRDATAIERPRHLCLLPLSTLLENVAGVYAPLLAAGEICVPAPGLLGFSGSALKQPQRLLREISAQQPDTMILTPQLLSLLVTAVAQGWKAPESLQFVAVGGARVSSHTLLEARKAGIPVYEGYGLSECASVVSLNTPAQDRPGYCGKVLPGIEVRIEAGEIVISGSSMLGYANDPPSWHQTEIASGDLGQFDVDGFLQVNGRRKNLLISSYGRNIAPEWVESELLASPLIAEAVVVGDALPCCAALLALQSDAIVDADVQAWIDRVNATLPDYARVQHWLRLPERLAKNPVLMTANGRPRRDAINSVYERQIRQLYAESQHNYQAVVTG